MSATPGIRVACGASTRAQSITFTLARRAAMTPEQAADDEYCAEVTKMETYTVLARPETGPGLVQFRVFGDPEIEAARKEALSSSERLAYVQRRSKEIRAERARLPAQASPATENKPGSHAAMAAVLNAAEETTGRALTQEEREELIEWVQKHAAPPPGEP